MLESFSHFSSSDILITARGDSAGVVLDEACLVNFEERDDTFDRVLESTHRNTSVETLGDVGEKRGNLVCIIDEFGRSMWVERGRYD